MNRLRDEIRIQARPARRVGRKRTLFSSALVALLTLAALLTTAYADTEYKVQPGDTLSGIASAYGVTVEAIVAANSLESRSKIYAGQLLTIPDGAASSETGTLGTTAYTVQPGDSLSSLAAKLGVSRQALADANAIGYSSFLYVGQVLRIPASQDVGAPSPTSPLPTSAPPSATATATSRTNGATVSSTPATKQSPTRTTVPEPPTTSPTNAAPTATSTATAATAATPSSTSDAPARYTVQPGDTLSSIATRFGVGLGALLLENKLTDPNSVRSGQVLVIPQASAQNRSSVTTLRPRVPMGKLGPKWIDVDLSTQTMVAYEGSEPVYSSLISSGTSRFPTVEGTYFIYLKNRLQRMRGGTGSDYYDIPDVPHVMYFFEDYGFHGAYWHNNFGQPMSHGCVNLPLEAARWLYEWAPIGTLVVTHE